MDVFPDWVHHILLEANYMYDILFDYLVHNYYMSSTNTTVSIPVSLESEVALNFVTTFI